MPLVQVQNGADRNRTGQELCLSETESVKSSLAELLLFGKPIRIYTSVDVYLYFEIPIHKYRHSMRQAVHENVVRMLSCGRNIRGFPPISALTYSAKYESGALYL